MKKEKKTKRKLFICDDCGRKEFHEVPKDTEITCDLIICAKCWEDNDYESQL